MAAAQKYRNKSTGVEVHAVQYGLPGRPTKGDSMRIASFLLGVDTDIQVGILNERMLDVVVPIPSRWNPDRGIADILAVDLRNSEQFTMELGDWLVRFDDSTLVKVAAAAFERGYEVVGATREQVEFDELVEIIYKSFPHLEGDIYKAIARRTAKDVTAAGWSRRGRSE